MYLLGFDIGSSSIKASLVRAADGHTAGVVQQPAREMDMLAVAPGWAEQYPETQWWENVCVATRQLLAETGVAPDDIKGIGISYQMHGLVLVDKDQQVLRPAIIWCDSRAVEIGNQAFTTIGERRCLEHLLNSPGNFTASKLKWVREHEPAIYQQIHKMMLPGDYIAMKLTGEIHTTVSGLSEGILWDFQENDLADLVLDAYGLDRTLIPETTATFSIQGKVNRAAAGATGLTEGTPVTYRAGDQPNNALSLNVLNPGEVAATGGTSGVIYGIVDRPVYDDHSRVNGFAHVNYEKSDPRIGILLCINGAGIQYSWMKHQVSTGGMDYGDLEKQAATVSIGADGLHILPFGNGAERVLRNQNIGAQILGLEFNRHQRPHLYRAALEGIAFAFVYGGEIMQEMGLEINMMRVGNDNLFRSRIFSETIATLLDCQIEVVETTGATGAARAAGVAVGAFGSLREALSGLKTERTYQPVTASQEAYRQAYQVWKSALQDKLFP